MKINEENLDDEFIILASSGIKASIEFVEDLQRFFNVNAHALIIGTVLEVSNTAGTKHKITTTKNNITVIRI